MNDLKAIKKTLLRKIDPFIALKPRTVFEVEARLRLHIKRYYSKDPVVSVPDCGAAIQEVLEYLIAEKILDDAKYAQDYSDYLHHTAKPQSPLKIRISLLKRGLSETLIDKVTSSLSDDVLKNSLLQLAQKKLRSYTRFDKQKQKRMLFTYLLGKGYASEEVRSAVDIVVGVK
jgi:SOS response regulatory protein OraA/RecX